MTRSPIQTVNLILPGCVNANELLGRQRFRGRYWDKQQLLNLIPLRDHESCSDAERYEGEVFIEDDSLLAIKLEEYSVPIPLNVVTEADRNERLPFKDRHREVINSARVVMIGCGSLGGAVAPLLVRGGVRQLTLCDPGVFVSHNLSRHIGTALDLGRPKPEIVADQLRLIDPGVEVEVITEDVLGWEWSRRRDFWTEADVVIATADKRWVQLCVNEDLVRRGQEKIPVQSPGHLPGVGIFAGCFDEARGGEVFVSVPGGDAPCLACLRGGLDGPQRAGTMDYSTATGADDFRGEPGLDAAVNQVAAVTAQVVLAVLLRGCMDSELGKLISPERNYLLVGTALSDGFYRFGHPFQAGFQPLSGKRRDCPICGVVDQSDSGLAAAGWVDLDACETGVNNDC